MTSKKILALITFASLLTLLVMVAYMEREYLDKKLLIRYMHGEDYTPIAERFHRFEDGPFRCIRHDSSDLEPTIFSRSCHCPMDIYVDRRGKLWAMENGIFHRFHRPMGFMPRRSLVIEPKTTPATIPDGIVQEETRVKVFGNGMAREVIRIRRGRFHVTGKMMSHNRTWPMSSAIGFPVRSPNKKYVVLYVPLRSREMIRRFGHPERHHHWSSLSSDGAKYQVVGNGSWMKVRLPIYRKHHHAHSFHHWMEPQIRPCTCPEIPSPLLIRYGGVSYRHPTWSPVGHSENATEHHVLKKELHATTIAPNAK